MRAAALVAVVVVCLMMASHARARAPAGSCTRPGPAQLARIPGLPVPPGAAGAAAPASP